tara:strand:- start:117 stop:1061 length:945 start_codon:yes stop_codon:yes gene_type:complete
MQLNETNLVDRNNRPTVLQKVALRAFFINDGEYYDPADISGVTIFSDESNFSPSSILSGNILSPTILSSTVLMSFGASANDSGAALNVSSYVPTDASSLSGVYRVKQGEYVCVLDGTQGLSGEYSMNGSSLSIKNGASAVGDYIDCWTIKFADGSDYQTIINNFALYNDTFFSVTEPVILQSRNKLINKHVTLSSIENLKITTSITIQNNSIDDSIKNIFRQSAITSGMVKIDKINEDSTTLPSHVTVSGFSDTSGHIDITSDNTLIFNFDTTTLATHPNVAEFAGLTGSYRITAKYNLLNETIVTPPYYFIVS